MYYYANSFLRITFGHLNISPLWWVLALGADLGGNGTLICSSAGVVAVGISIKYGQKISFIRWLKIGFPFMILTVALGFVILMLMTWLSL